MLPDDLRGLAGALQGARIDRGDPGTGKPAGGTFGLRPSALRQHDAWHAPGADATLYIVLAVAEQMKNRRGRIFRRSRHGAQVTALRFRVLRDARCRGLLCMTIFFE